MDFSEPCVLWACKDLGFDQTCCYLFYYSLDGFGQVVHTQAKVLTNQDVLYKYLNKNTLFVATVAPRGSETIGETSPEENWLVVYVIDTVTGQILHRLKHPNMHGPVHAVRLKQVSPIFLCIHAPY